MEGEGCVLLEKDIRREPGRGDLGPSLRIGGQLVWGAGMCRRWWTVLSLGPSVGLGEPGTQDRMSAPRLTEEPCSQRVEQGVL